MVSAFHLQSRSVYGNAPTCISAPLRNSLAGCAVPTVGQLSCRSSSNQRHALYSKNEVVHNGEMFSTLQILPSCTLLLQYNRGRNNPVNSKPRTKLFSILRRLEDRAHQIVRVLLHVALILFEKSAGSSKTCVAVSIVGSRSLSLLRQTFLTGPLPTGLHLLISHKERNNQQQPKSCGMVAPHLIHGKSPYPPRFISEDFLRTKCWRRPCHTSK